MKFNEFFLKPSVLGLLCLFTASASAAECKGKFGCVKIGPGEPIVIGVLQALSGKVQPSGERYLRTTELAIDDKQGQLLGHPISLLIEDSQCSREGGTVSALKLAADPQVIAVIGTTCSGAARGASKILSRAGLVMISGSNTSPSLTAIGDQPGRDWRPGYFRTAHNDADQGKAAAQFAYQFLQDPKAATIDDGDSYTKGLARAFQGAFTKLGGEIVLITGVNKGDTNMRPVLDAVVSSEAKLVFIPVFQPEGDQIVLQASAHEGFKGITLMGADGLLLGSFLDSVGDSGVGMYFVGPAKIDSLEHQEFVTKFENKYSQKLTTNFHAQFYDATNLLLAAIETASTEEQDGTLYIGREALRQALYSTKNFVGLTGRLTCNRFGDCGSARFTVVRIDEAAAGIDGLKSNEIFRYRSGE